MTQPIYSKKGGKRLRHKLIGVGLRLHLVNRRPIKTYGGKYYICKNDDDVEYRHVTENNKAA